MKCSIFVCVCVCEHVTLCKFKMLLIFVCKRITALRKLRDGLICTSLYYLYVFTTVVEFKKNAMSVYCDVIPVEPQNEFY